eukprot:gnl/TRDRNA2_/TRDRNA2_188551_c0_seq1.p1 gnl/TRDRNA2_/TRDRNA2_188551_c0~~gnl/TRDRNA2_/TRDRNA2_188551_c0_seq1.p1  ORF type:complete len:294 (+),score=71.78 gnl/TRDRNA2_/TRDRNA2_188551_c0_seq1:72-953(+)
MAARFQLAILASVLVVGLTNATMLRATRIARALSERDLVQEGNIEDRECAVIAGTCEKADSEARKITLAVMTSREKSEATIANMTADIVTADTLIAKLAASVAASEVQIQQATEQREEEAQQLAELKMGVHELETAISDMSTSKGTTDLTSVVLNAASFDAHYRLKLRALVESQQDDEAEEALGAAAAIGYESRSSDIRDVLQDMKFEADMALADASIDEPKAKLVFDTLMLSLMHGIAEHKRDRDEAVEWKNESLKVKARAEGELAEANNKLVNANLLLERPRVGLSRMTGR